MVGIGLADSEVRRARARQGNTPRAATHAIASQTRLFQRAQKEAAALAPPAHLLFALRAKTTFASAP
jgi:hypothetical protein